VKFNRHVFQKLSVQARDSYRKAISDAVVSKPELTPEQRERLEKVMKRALRAREPN